MNKYFNITLGTIILLIGVTAGCSDDTVATNPATSPVNLSVGFSKIGTRTSLLKTSATDSLRIDSVVVVMKRIKFESHIDDVAVDSTGKDTVDNDIDANYMFKGPFLIHIRDSMTVNFALQTLPAGTYTGIKFKIHAVKKGEYCQNSDVYNHRSGIYNSDSLAGYSIAVWGSIVKNGVRTPFAFKSTVEVEYKMKGNFTLTGSTSSVTMALRFNTADWFVNLSTGAMLDPTDISSTNRALINQAIKKSFEKGRGGKDANNDGQPDNN